MKGEANHLQNFGKQLTNGHLQNAKQCSLQECGWIININVVIIKDEC